MSYWRNMDSGQLFNSGKNKFTSKNGGDCLNFIISGLMLAALVCGAYIYKTR